MDWITDISALERLYGMPSEAAVRKVSGQITPPMWRAIERARFCVLSSVGPEGTDGSPRGDRDPVVRIHDEHTILMPDWQGNNRIDTLRNILSDGRVSLLFLVPGITYAIRVNGTARLTADPSLCASFEREGRHPRSVIVIRVAEVYPQCARAIQRSELWGDQPAPEGMPTMGAFIEAASEGAIHAPSYDAERATRAHLGWW